MIGGTGIQGLRKPVDQVEVISELKFKLMCYGCLNYCKSWGAEGISKGRLELGNGFTVLSSEVSCALGNNLLAKDQRQERKK